jgi:ADP-ribose pyrophosphatase YjhB (NUDIX family)
LSQFCLRCGGELRPRLVDHRERPACPACGWVLFLDPKVAVAAVLELAGGIVLCRRAIEPGLGKWSFPAGFVDRGEEVKGALLREIREETGLDAALGRLVGVYSAAGNPVVLIVYAAKATGTLQPSAEAFELAVFEPRALPEMAFAHDETIVADWLRAESSQPD